MFAFLSMTAKLIGALYRIPLTNVMGAEGIGLYQMVFPLYTVLLTATSGGLTAAIAKVTAAYNATGDERSSFRTLKVTLTAVIAVTFIAASALVLFRGKIAFVQGNRLAAVSYLGIAPSIVLVGIISCFRGYYQGSQNMLPSALSQLTEQTVKLVAGLALCKALLPYGVQYAVLGALTGVTVSELAALLGLLVQYFFTRRAVKARTVIDIAAPVRSDAEVSAELAPAMPVRHIKRASLIKNVCRVALPVTLGALVMPLTQVIDSILVINILARATDTAYATSLYGVLNGPVNSLINMPVVVTTAVSVALLPKISAASATGAEVSRTVSVALKYSLLIAFPAAGALAVFSRDILSLLYSRSVDPALIGVGSSLLRLGCVTVVYTAFIQVATAVLQGCDRPRVPAVNLVIGAAVKVLFTVLLLGLTGIYGAVAASALCYGVTAALDVAALVKRTPLRAPFYRTAVAPALASAAALAAAYGIFKAVETVAAGIWPLVAAAAAAIVLYPAALAVSGAFGKDELSALPVVGGFFKASGKKNGRDKEKFRKAADKKVK